MPRDTKTALLLLDLQNEMVSAEGKIGAGPLSQAIEDAGVLERAGSVLDWARAAGLEIVHVRLGFRTDYLDALSVAPRIQKLKENGAAQLGEWGTEFAREVAPRADELIITKQCVNPFFNTQLLNWLLHRGVDHIVLAGVVTNLVVEATARYADDAGLAVTVLSDCCAAPDPELHRFSVERILPMFGTVTTAEEFLASP